MEMSIKKDYGTRRRLLAVAFFFGVSAIAAQVSADNLLDEETVSTVSSESLTEEEKTSDSVLHVSGTGNDATQQESISLTEKGAIAILVEGSENQITIPKGTTINLSGKNGKGILITDGYGHILNVGGNIFSAGNAVEFNFSGDEFLDALVKNFNLSGRLTGYKNAIYIGKNSFVENINLNKGAKVFGNITSNWMALDAGKYIPDLVTKLNVNADVTFSGNISGGDSIKIYVNNGTMNFSGEADVLGVDVGVGAKLFGGTFTLNDKSAILAEGFTDTTTGTFINHGTIGASSPDTNLIINGNLISDGTLKKISGGKAGSIIVNGVANVEGSTVITDSPLPNETATVLTANSITGNIKNSVGNPVPISATLNATGKIVGNTLVVITHTANNVSMLDSKEAKTFDAMNEMFDKLDDEKQDEMRQLYNMELPETKRTLTQIGSNDAAQIMSVAQQNTAVDKMISSRISKVFATEYMNLNISPLKFSDGEDTAPEMTVKVKIPSRQENNLWLNYMKNWGSLNGGTDYHGSVIVAGYDRPIGKKWRAGIFATYGTIGYSANSSRATVYDTRLGLYTGYHNRQSDVYFYINGGQLRNSLHRGISSLGLSMNAKYKSHIVEVGGEYKYDLTPKEIWHISPFVNFQMSHLKQNAYNEHGADIYNQHVEAGSNTYFAAQTGLDLKRYYQTGMLGFKVGVKHGFTGADPDIIISYEGDTSNRYRLRQKRDKTHLVVSVRGENEFARGWFVGGEAELQRGENDKEVTASIMLRRTW